MSYNVKNYTEQGGDVTHFGGKVLFEEGSQVEGLPQAENLPTTATNAQIVTALKEAGLMEPDQWNASAGLAPSPTEQVLVDNKAKVESVVLEDGVITITVDPDELEESASSVPSQGTHKWLGLEIGTGISDITKVKYNGVLLTAADATEAQSVGCAEGSFVLYVKTEELLDTPKEISLKSDGYALLILSIRVVRPNT